MPMSVRIRSGLLDPASKIASADIASFTDGLHVGLGVDELPKPGADDGVGVDD
jgi:hypothetical protein